MITSGMHASLTRIYTYVLKGEYMNEKGASNNRIAGPTESLLTNHKMSVFHKYLYTGALNKESMMSE